VGSAASDHQWLVDRARKLCEDDGGRSAVGRVRSVVTKRLSHYESLCAAGALRSNSPDARSELGCRAVARARSVDTRQEGLVAPPVSALHHVTSRVSLSPRLRELGVLEACRPAAIAHDSRSSLMSPRSDCPPRGGANPHTTCAGELQPWSALVEQKVLHTPRTLAAVSKVQLAEMDRLQYESVELLRERRMLVAEVREREGRLLRQARELSGIRTGCRRLEDEEAQLEHRVGQAERRAVEVTRATNALEVVVAELRSRAVAADFGKCRLREEAEVAETSLRTVCGARAELERQSGGAGAELRALRCELTDTTAELDEVRARGRASVATSQHELDMERRRLLSSQEQLWLHQSEARAAGMELQRCRTALASRGAEFRPLEADARAAKAAEQRVDALELEIMAAAQDVCLEAREAADHKETRSELELARLELSSMWNELDRGRGVEAIREVELGISCERTHVEKDAPLVELELELAEVHTLVDCAGRELQVAAAELPAARAVAEGLRAVRSTSEVLEQDLKRDLGIQRALALDAVADLEHALERRKALDQEIHSTAFECTTRQADLACDRWRLKLEAQKAGRDGIGDRRTFRGTGSPGVGEDVLFGLESQLRCAEAAAEGEHADLEREGDELGRQAVVLTQRRDCALARTQEVRAVLQAVEAERARAEAQADAELEAISIGAAASHEELGKRIGDLQREVATLQESTHDLQDAETRLEALNVGLRQQVCLLRAGGRAVSGR